MDNHEISVAADKAADYIEQHGHTKHQLWDNEGRVCLLGALYKTETYNVNVPGAVASYLDLRTVGTGGFGSSQYGLETAAVNWNNADERTAQEVIDVLRDVATKYRSDAC